MRDQNRKCGGAPTTRLLVVGAEKRTGGGEEFLHRLACGLGRRPDFRVTAMLPEGADVAARIRADPRCAVIRVVTSRHLVRLLDAGPGRFAASLVRANREILGIVRREGPDVVLFNGLGASAGGLLARLFGRGRQVAVIHNLRFPRTRTFYLRWLLSVHELVCVSHAVAVAVASPANRRRIRVIPNGVPIGPPPPAGKREGPGPLRVLAAGRITPWKGHHVLLEALGLLRARTAPGPLPVEVEIAGRSWSDEEREYEAGLRRAVERAGLAERVRFVGHVPLEAWMERAHCLVHTAVEPEPFGLVVAEAMERGLLVVATDAGGVREFVRDGETGWLVPPGDAPALARCLEWLMLHRSDPEARAVAARARRLIVSDYSLDRQVEAYARLLSGRRSAVV